MNTTEKVEFKYPLQAGVIVFAEKLGYDKVVYMQFDIRPVNIETWNSAVALTGRLVDTECHLSASVKTSEKRRPPKSG